MITAYEYIKNPLIYEDDFQSPFINGKISYDSVIDFLRQIHVVYENKTIYFMDTNEEYHAVKESELFSLIKAYIRTYSVNLNFNVTNQVFNNVLLNMQDLSADALKRELEEFVQTEQGRVYEICNHDDFGIIHVKNGVINVEKGFKERYQGDGFTKMPELMAKNHMLFLMRPYNVTYEPLDHDRLFNSPYMEPYEIMFPDEPTRNVFFMAMGMILFSPYTWKMLPVLYGPPHTGKSVIGLVLNAILGDEYMSATPLNSLTSRFGLADADKYILNLVPEGGSDRDASMSSTQCGIVKSLTGGDTVSIERKHKDSYTAKPTMKLMISTNHMPQFPPDEEGILARLFIFPLMQPLPFTEQMKVNPNYVPDMTRSPEALNWFFNRCLVGYFQLCEYTHNNLESLRTPYMMECMEDYKRGDEFLSWVDARYGGMTFKEIQETLSGAVNRDIWMDFSMYVEDEWGRRSKLERIGFMRKLCSRYDMKTWNTRDRITGEVVKKLCTQEEYNIRKENSKDRY